MRLDELQITIAGVRFDRVGYDAEADVLYLHVGDPSTATDLDESPEAEGHQLRFDSEGRLVGITLVGVRKDLEAGHRVTVTLAEPVEVGEIELRRLIQTA